MRSRTLDREADAFFTTEVIGRTRELTPEGFLLCRDVRIARIGEMLYGEGEVPLEVGRDKIIHVTRDAAELFRPETIASINGKDIVDEHPDDDVSPENYQSVTAGVALNPRAGEGADAGYLLADFLVKDAAAIAAVDAGKREVSLGYDADYEQTGPGRGRQFNIIVNHVALVDKGRCGPRCAIGDSDMKTRDKKRSWKDRVMTAFKARDEAALEEAMTMAEDEMTNGVEGDSGPGSGAGGEHVIRIEVAGPKSAVESQETQGQGVVTDEAAEGEAAPAWFTKARAEDKSWRDGIEERLGKIEGGTGDEATGNERTDPAETNDEESEEEAEREATGDEEAEGAEGRTGDRARTGDSASLGAAFQEMLARAEILAPGIKLPTFDSKAKRAQTVDRMCAFKRRAVVKALDDEETRELLSPLVGKRDPSKITCDSMSTIFAAGSELVKKANSTVTRTGYVHDHAGAAGAAKPSIAEMNQKARDFWRAKGGAS